MYDDAQANLIARHYDAAYAVLREPSGDAAFYLHLARESRGCVLELGCGTGRILLPIAREGIDCVGVDASAAMLHVLREKDPPSNLTLVEGRMEELDLLLAGEGLEPGSFALVTAPFRVLSHLLDVESQLTTLAAIRRQLALGGRFAFDLFDPKLDRIALALEPEHLDATFTQEGATVRRFVTVRRDHSAQVMTALFRFESDRRELEGTAELQMRWFYRYELEHLLARAGFAHVELFGAFDRRPWVAGGETVVVAET